jgi:hypothetical protein
MANDPPEEVQRWTAKRRVALVVSILKAETSGPGNRVRYTMS